MIIPNISPEEKPALIATFQSRRDSLQAYLRVQGMDKQCCPCCGYPTLSERGAYEICIICDWEDDGQGDEDADKVLGGPNGKSSLTDDRLIFEKNFRDYEQTSGRRRIIQPDIIISVINRRNDELNTIVNSVDFESDLDDHAPAEDERYLELTYGDLTHFERNS